MVETLGVTVGLLTVINYGTKKKYFGDDDGGFPRRYKWEVAKRACDLIAERQLDGRIRLTDQQVDEILQNASKEKLSVLARRYGVHESYISRLRSGERRINR